MPRVSQFTPLVFEEMLVKEKRRKNDTLKHEISRRKIREKLLLNFRSKIIMLFLGVDGQFRDATARDKIKPVESRARL